jgi:hypothetical protein
VQLSRTSATVAAPSVWLHENFNVGVAQDPFAFARENFSQIVRDMSGGDRTFLNMNKPTNTPTNQTTDTTAESHCHPTFHRLATLGRRKDLLVPESYPDFAELFPLRVPVESDEVYALYFEPGEQVPIKFLTPRFAHALFEGILGSYTQLSEELFELCGGEECGYSFLEDYLPPGLYESLSASRCDGYFFDLLAGLTKRADYLLRSLSNGVVPDPICTADEWLLHVSSWWISDIWADFEDPLFDALPSHEGDDLDLLSELLLDDEDLLMLWDPEFAGITSTVRSVNEFGAPIYDFAEAIDPDGRLRLGPLHPDGWFLPFFGETWENS